jgi:hypothetical protein
MVIASYFLEKACQKWKKESKRSQNKLSAQNLGKTEEISQGMPCILRGGTLRVKCPLSLREGWTSRLGNVRSVAQLVEHRSPKPVVRGSSPLAPASEQN